MTTLPRGTLPQQASQDDVKASGGDRMWSRSLILLGAAIFLLSLGSGLQNGVSTNFMKELGLTGSQVLLQSGIREIPGLALMFLAALVMHLPLTWRSAASGLTMRL